MNQQPTPSANRNKPEAIPVDVRQIDGRAWWMFGFAVSVTLTLGIVSFTLPWFNRATAGVYWFDLRQWVC